MNNLLTKLNTGNVGQGVFACIDSALSARALAMTGLDFMILDQQHGLIDSQHLDQMITALIDTPCSPVVRVANNDPALIMGALDRGAVGIVCPLVNTGEQAANFIHALRYPPEGGRSYGPLKPNLYYGTDYTQKANGQILAIAQIETKEAVENLDHILSTPGLDAILVGPNDLGFTYGNQPQAMPEDPNVIAAMKKIATACKAKGIHAGIHCGDVNMAKEMISWGYQFMTIGTDVSYLQAFANQTLQAMDNTSHPLPNSPTSY